MSYIVSGGGGFFSYFLPLWAIASTIFVTVLVIDRNLDQITREAKETSTLEIGISLFNQTLTNVVYDALFISRSEILTRFLRSKKTRDWAYLAKDLVVFSKVSGVYDQVRFIDMTGMEVMRVDYNNGDPSITPQTKLQNKAGRSYFTDSIDLNAGEVYLSRIDLNIKGGKIEQPYVDKNENICGNRQGKHHRPVEKFPEGKIRRSRSLTGSNKDRLLDGTGIKNLAALPIEVTVHHQHFF